MCETFVHIETALNAVHPLTYVNVVCTQEENHSYVYSYIGNYIHTYIGIV